VLHYAKLTYKQKSLKTVFKNISADGEVISKIKVACFLLRHNV